MDFVRYRHPANGSPGKSCVRVLQQALELLGITDTLNEEAVGIVPVRQLDAPCGHALRGEAG